MSADENAKTTHPDPLQSDGYHILAEQYMSLDDLYVADLAVKRENDQITCAVARSDNVCEVFSLAEGQLKSLTTLKGHIKTVTNVKFTHDSNQLLYSSSLDGKMKLWDLRNGQCVKELKDTGCKPLLCMDVSVNDRILCAGTELVDGDSFLLFFDVRSRQLLGGYWESHTEDITTVAFHPTETDTVASSSTDGLVNLFDLRESSEDDALQTSLNTENSVSRLRWNSEELLSVTTHTETVQLWERDGAAPRHQWAREDVASVLSSNSNDAYVVNLHTRLEGDMFLLAGCNSDNAKESQLQTLSLSDEKLKPGLQLIGNRQLIRVSEYLPEKDILVTGGENGLLSIWKPDLTRISSVGKKATKTRSKQGKTHKPY